MDLALPDAEVCMSRKYHNVGLKAFSSRRVSIAWRWCSFIHRNPLSPFTNSEV
jgi:hypothetical protein